MRDKTKVINRLKNKRIHNYDPDVVFEQYASRFWFFCAVSMYRANRRCVLPLMYITMQLEFRGLSRIGRSLLSTMGAAPAIRNYDVQKNKLVKNYAAKVQQMVQDNDCIVTWDNYCHVWGSPTLKMRDTSYLKANYTVVAVSAYDFKERPRFCWTYVGDEDTEITSFRET